MNCPNCNALNRAEARFCALCGAALSSPVPDAEVPVSGEPDEVRGEDISTAPTPEVETSAASAPAEPTVEMPIPSEPVERVAAGPASSAPVETPAPTPPDEASAADTAPLTPDGADAQEVAVSPVPTAPHSVEPESSLPVGPSSPGPLPPGTLLQERFEILGMVGHEGEEALYRAWDRAQCWQCGTTETPRGEAFCASCGAELAARQVLCQVRETFAEPVETAADAIASFDANGRWYVVWPEERVSAEPEKAEGGLRLSVGFASHPGQVREHDEDSLLVLTLSGMSEGRTASALGFYAVADGLGGHEGGEVASRMAVRIVADWVARRVLLPEVMGETCLEETAVALLTLAVQEANARIYQLRQRQGSEMGSTFTAALVRGDVINVVNVGDSRTYLWRDGKLEQITTDHSAVARLVEVGEVQPEDMYAHPQRSTIYRSLGDKPAVNVDSFTRRLGSGDRLLLCCDGIWESLRRDGLEEVLLAEPYPQRAADEMIKRSNMAGGEDNLSAIVVAIEG